MAFIGIVSKAAIQPVDFKTVKVSKTSKKTLKPLSLDYMGLTQIEPASRVRELLENAKKSCKMKQNLSVEHPDNFGKTAFKVKRNSGSNSANLSGQGVYH